MLPVFIGVLLSKPTSNISIDLCLAHSYEVPILIAIFNGLKPQEKLSLEAKINIHFAKFTEALPLSDIAAKVGTSYEYARRTCTEMYELGLLSRTKVETGNKGRPTYLYGPL